MLDILEISKICIYTFLDIKESRVSLKKVNIVKIKFASSVTDTETMHTWSSGVADQLISFKMSVEISQTTSKHLSVETSKTAIAFTFAEVIIHWCISYSLKSYAFKITLLYIYMYSCTELFKGETLNTRIMVGIVFFYDRFCSHDNDPVLLSAYPRWTVALQCCHNGHDGVSHHQHHDCLLSRLFRHRSKKT